MPQSFSYFTNIPQFLFTWGIFISAAFAFYAWQVYNNRTVISIRDLARHCFPFHPFRSKSFRMDVIIYIFRKFTDGVFMVPGVALLGLLAVGTSVMLRDMYGRVAPGGIGMIGYFVGALFIAFFIEFAYYLYHLAEHRIPCLWELHKVHHSAEVLNPLTDHRAHSVAILLRYIVEGTICGVPTGVVMYRLNMALPDIVLMTVFGTKFLTVVTMDSVKHSHIPLTFGALDKLFISPFMHQAHHGSAEIHWDKNFGTNLSIFDWMFGTAYRPEKGEQIAYGIHGYTTEALQEFNTFKGSFVAPLKRSAEALARPFATVQMAG